MLCSNCGKNEANVRYTHIVNGEKTEYNLCDECAKKLGIDDIDFNMPINFSNFLSDFFEDETLLPSFSNIQISKCPKCGLTFDDFAKNGKFGCGECYNTFSNKIESILKNLHGSSTHRGKKLLKTAENNTHTTKPKSQENKESQKENTIQNKIKELNEKINLAIKEERYEDAATIRDEIKKIQKQSKNLE